MFIFELTQNLLNVLSQLFIEWFYFVYYSQLRDAFIFELTQGYSHYDRQLRNDLLVIASLVASKCTEAPFVETGFAKQLTTFATFQEGIKNLYLLLHKQSIGVVVKETPCPFHSPSVCPSDCPFHIMYIHSIYSISRDGF